VVAGIVIGLGGAIALGRVLESILFQTRTVDAPTLIAVGVLFLTVALLACFVPAWRAARIDPMSALRQD
jgi:putative ABC transport system permease protein